MKKTIFIFLFLILLLSACSQQIETNQLYMYEVFYDGETYTICANGVGGLADIYLRFYIWNENGKMETVAGFPAPLHFTGTPVDSCEQ